MDDRLDPTDSNMIVSQAYKALTLADQKAAPDPEEDKKKKLLSQYGFAAYDLMAFGQGGGGKGW